MKKILSLILATLMVLTAVAALAEAAPSKTAEDMAYVVKTVDSNSGDGVIIKIVDLTETFEKLLQDTLDALTNGTNPIELFAEGTQEALNTKLGAEAEVELNELWPIDVFGYQQGVHGDLTGTFYFPTVYTAEQTLVAVVAVNTADGVKEFVLDGTLLDDGNVDIVFPAEVIAEMLAGTETNLYMLNTK